MKLDGRWWSMSRLGQASVELWSINRVLRFTGWRLYIEVDGSPGVPFHPVKPTRIGFRFYGWRDLLS